VRVVREGRGAGCADKMQKAGTSPAFVRREGDSYSLTLYWVGR
jgi:hypothetical protein